jgi:polyphosphate kinase
MKLEPPLTAAPLDESQQTFLSRELGVLAFNERVFAQAEHGDVPLLERLRFLCITSSNLDEFFEIRVAGLKEQLLQNPGFKDVDGLSVLETYQLVSERSHQLVARQYDLLNRTLLPQLEHHGVYLHLVTSWTDVISSWAQDYFNREILPVLTPIGLDPAHPFPRVLNKSLNFAVELGGEDAFNRNSGVAIVQAPRALPRLIKLPDNLSPYRYSFVMLTSIMQAFVADLFPGMEVKGCHQFRVTRNSDLFVDDEEITNLRVALQGELPQRHFGDAVRLEISENCSEPMAQLLMKEFELEQRDVYRVSGPVNLVRLMQLPELVEIPELKFPPFAPGLPVPIRKAKLKNSDLFKVISKNDVLLHHPYQSFNPVLDFLHSAATDPRVVAIKQTIYRTGTDSALMDVLIAAAKSGKEVTVVVELMARFDEETNINWAARLEQVGAHVVYGVVGHKTHCKMALVVRREINKNGTRRLKRYAHLGTGNYHPRTARSYTDFGLFTADEAICEDVHQVFQQLTGLGRAKDLNRLWQAPFTMHARMLAAIKFEIAEARAGRTAHIMAKMNSLLEPEVIKQLYLASQAGVRIDLIVRGVCALRPGVAGLSENITVRSIIGRFLEHSRIFYFHAGGEEVVLLSSADWMDRNFFRRIELAFPVQDAKLKARVVTEGLRVHLRDNVLAWLMDGTGRYVRRRAGSARYDGQQKLIDQLAS